MPVTQLDPNVQLDTPKKTRVVELSHDVKLDEPPSGGASMWRGFEQGVGDVFMGGRQLAALAGLGDKAALTKKAREREESYASSPGEREHPVLSGIGRFGGNVVGTAPTLIGGPEALGSGLLARFGLGALRGAAGGALMPKTTDRPLGETMRQAAVGGVAGGALEGATSALGGMAAPRLAPDAAELAKKGVVLSPGQMFRKGNISRDIEERSTSLPLLGKFIQDKRARSIDTFNAATINQALEPIGVTLGKTTAAGHDAVKFMGDEISKAYNTTLAKIPNVSLSDPDLVKDIGRIMSDAQQRPAVWANYKGVMDDLIVNKLKRGRPMTGAEVQKWTSDLWRQSNQLRKSPEFFQREEGRLLGETRTALLDAVARQHPNVGRELEDVNHAFAMSVRIEDAAARRAGSEGRFTPMDLLAASKADASGVRKRQFARGDAVLQKWAETGQRVLPSTLGESGTTPRAQLLNPLAWAAGLGGLPIYAPLAAAGRSQPGAVRSALGETGRGFGRLAPAAGAFLSRADHSDTMRRAAQPVSPPTQP